jgi:hypothetical protein
MNYLIELMSWLAGLASLLAISHMLSLSIEALRSNSNEDD